MDDKDLNDFLNSGKVLDKYFMSHSDRTVENLITLDIKTAKLVTDNNGHSKHNIQFEGFLNKCYISDRVLENIFAIIIFPKISFKNMLMRSGMSLQDLTCLFKSKDYLQIKFIKKSNTRYDIKRKELKKTW